MNVLDIEKVAAIAHEAGVPLVIDNTMGVRPTCAGRSSTAPISWCTPPPSFWAATERPIGGIIVDSGKFPWER